MLRRLSKKSLFWPSAVIPLLLAGCATSYVTGEPEFILFSEETEINMGKNFSGEYLKEHDTYPDKELRDYVKDIGNKIARASHRPGLPYQFEVINEDTVNAFTFPGGQVFVYTGLLEKMENEAELAAVLAHEIGHNTARHGIKKLQANLGIQILSIAASVATGKDITDITANALNILLLGYSRQEELQADRLGLQYLINAAYNPEAMVWLQKIFLKMKEEEPSGIEKVLSTHPPSSERINKAQEEIVRLKKEIKIEVKGLVDEEEYKEKIHKRIEKDRDLMRSHFSEARLSKTPDGIVTDKFSVKNIDITMDIHWKDVKKELYKVSIELYEPKGRLVSKIRDKFTPQDTFINTTHTLTGIGIFAEKNNLIGKWKAKVLLNGFPVHEKVFYIESR